MEDGNIIHHYIEVGIYIQTNCVCFESFVSIWKNLKSSFSSWATHSSSHLNDLSPADGEGREVNTFKMVFRWAVVGQACRRRQDPRPLPSCNPAPSHEPGGPRLALHRLSAHCSYTNRSSFQKTTSTMERGAGMVLLSEGIWGPWSDLGFSYKAKHRSLSTPNVEALL